MKLSCYYCGILSSQTILREGSGLIDEVCMLVNEWCKEDAVTEPLTSCFFHWLRLLSEILLELDMAVLR